MAVLLINHQNQTNNLADISNLNGTAQMSDPISKLYFHLNDVGSTINLQVGQEVVVCDETIPLVTTGSTISGGGPPSAAESPYGVTYYVNSRPNNYPPPLCPQKVIDDLAGLSNGGASPTWLRYQLSWMAIEPYAPSDSVKNPNYPLVYYDWTNLDDVVAKIAAVTPAGAVRLFFPMEDAPQWRLSIAGDGTTAGYDGTVFKTTLNAGLTSGAAITSITVASLPHAIVNGSYLIIDYFGKNPNTVQVNHTGGYAASGSPVTINVVGAQGNPTETVWPHTYASGVQVWDTPFTNVLPSPTDFATFADALTGRYGNTIPWYQIGNEEWDTATRIGGASADNGGAVLAAIVHAVAPKIRTNAPLSKIDVCAVRKVPTNAAGHITNWMNSFFKAYTPHGPDCDAVDFHYYRGGSFNQDPTTQDTNTPSVATEIGLIVAAINSFGNGQLVLCTETGWEVNYYNAGGGNGTATPTNPVTPDTLQATYIKDMYKAFQTAAPTGKCFIFTMDDTSDAFSLTPTNYNTIQNYITNHPMWVSGGASPSGTSSFTPVFIGTPSVPTHNYLNNNNFNLGSTAWTISGTNSAALTFPSNPTYGTGAKATLTFANNAVGNAKATQTIPDIYAIAGQQYCFSGTLNITTAFTNATVALSITFLNAAGGVIITNSATFTATTGGAIRVSKTATAPASCVRIQAQIVGTTTSTTNTGVATVTALQLEPVWFSGVGAIAEQYTAVYPTPICDSLQPDSMSMIDGSNVRYNRAFAGQLVLAKPKYDGNNRIWECECSSLASYMDTDTLYSKNYTSTSDQQIVQDVIAPCAHLFMTYPSSITPQGPNFSYANIPTVQLGQIINSINFADNTPRDVLNALSNITGYVFGVDNYNDVFYQPALYNYVNYGFSYQPDFITTFPMYDYALTIDGTQIKNSVNVSGGTYQITITDAFVVGDGTHNQIINGGGNIISWNLLHAPISAPTLHYGGGGGFDVTVVLDTNNGFGSGGATYNPSIPGITGVIASISTGTAISHVYTYNATVYVQVQDPTSIAQYGARWGAVSDTGLVTLAAAQQRGEQELAQYSQPQLTLSFKTQTYVAPSMVVPITWPNDGFNSTNFVVQKVGIGWLGNNTIEYAVECGAYIPSVGDYMRNIQRVLTSTTVTAIEPLHLQVILHVGDGVTFNDSCTVS